MPKAPRLRALSAQLRPLAIIGGAHPATELLADGLAYKRIADQLRTEFENEAAITESAVAALLRADSTQKRTGDRSAGLSPRTVHYIPTIIHAALKDALRWNRVVRNVADAATPPSASAARSNCPKAWTAGQLRAGITS